MFKRTPFPLKSRSRQRGAVLAVGLILLLVMTLIMIVAMSGSILQERMAGAMRNESIADVGADSALRDGEVWVWSNIVAAGRQLSPSDTGYPYKPTVALVKSFRSDHAWVSGGSDYGSAGAAIEFPDSDYYRMAQLPAYMVEGLGEVGIDNNIPESHGGSSNTLNEAVHYYRITGRSTGGTESVVRAAESTFSISIFEN
jgi:type IV pilus assembly protein PilX